MKLLNGLPLLVVLFNSLLLARADYINPADCNIVFYYGPDYSDSMSYPLTAAAGVVGHSKFRSDHPTVLFVPDYHEPQLEEYHTHHVVDSYLRAGDVNMLFLDWGAPLAPADQVKDPDVAVLVPMTTDWLIEIHGLIDWDLVHVLAYAKGVEFISNVVRDLYRRTELRIHRITQMAPPQELIVDGKQVDEDKDLITVFIDAIHTDIGGQGANVSRAHADFYPNGGTAPQPGCPNEGLCSRRRSFLYYAESVNNPNAFCAYKADSYEDFKSKDTKELGESAPMGRFWPHSPNGKLYLDTNSESPFGKGC